MSSVPSPAGDAVSSVDSPKALVQWALGRWRDRQVQLWVTVLLILAYYVSLYTCIQNYVHVQQMFDQTGQMSDETIGQQPIQWVNTWGAECAITEPFFWAHQPVACTNQQLLARQPLSLLFPNTTYLAALLNPTASSSSATSVAQYWDGTGFIGGVYESQTPSGNRYSNAEETCFSLGNAEPSFDNSATQMLPSTGLPSWMQQMQEVGEAERGQPLYFEMLGSPTYLTSASDCVNQPFFTHKVLPQAVVNVPLSFSPVLDCVGVPLTDMPALPGSLNPLFSSGDVFVVQSLPAGTRDGNGDLGALVNLTAATLPQSTCHSVVSFPTFTLRGESCEVQQGSLVCQNPDNWESGSSSVVSYSSQDCEGDSDSGYYCTQILSYPLPLRQWPPFSQYAFVLAELRSTPGSSYTSLLTYSPASFDRVTFYHTVPMYNGYYNAYPVNGCWNEGDAFLVCDFSSITYQSPEYSGTMVDIGSFRCTISNTTTFNTTTLNSTSTILYICPTPLVLSAPASGGQLDMTGYTCLNQSSGWTTLNCWNAQDSTECALAGFVLELGPSVSCSFLGSLWSGTQSLHCSFQNDRAGVTLLTALALFTCTASSSSISCPHPFQAGTVVTLEVDAAGIGPLCDYVLFDSTEGDDLSFCIDSSLYYHQCDAKNPLLVNYMPPLARLFTYMAVGKELGKLVLFVILSVFSKARSHNGIQYLAKNVGMLVYTCWHRKSFLLYLTNIRVGEGYGGLRLIALDLFLQELPQLLFSILYMLATQSGGSAFNIVAFIVSLCLTVFSTLTILAASGLTCFNACKAIDFTLEEQQAEDRERGREKEKQRGRGEMTEKASTYPTGPPLVKVTQKDAMPKVHVYISPADNEGPGVEMAGMKPSTSYDYGNPANPPVHYASGGYTQSLPPPSYSDSVARTSQSTAPMDFAQQLALAMQDENVRNAIALTLAHHRLTPEPQLAINTPNTPSNASQAQRNE